MRFADFNEVNSVRTEFAVTFEYIFAEKTTNTQAQRNSSLYIKTRRANARNVSSQPLSRR